MFSVQDQPCRYRSLRPVLRDEISVLPWPQQGAAADCRGRCASLLALVTLRLRLAQTCIAGRARMRLPSEDVPARAPRPAPRPVRAPHGAGGRAVDVGLGARLVADGRRDAAHERRVERGRLAQFMGKLVVPRAESSGVPSPSGSVSTTPCRHSAPAAPGSPGSPGSPGLRPCPAWAGGGALAAPCTGSPGLLAPSGAVPAPPCRRCKQGWTTGAAPRVLLGRCPTVAFFVHQCAMVNVHRGGHGAAPSCPCGRRSEHCGGGGAQGAAAHHSTPGRRGCPGAGRRRWGAWSRPAAQSSRPRSAGPAAGALARPPTRPCPASPRRSAPARRPAAAHVLGSLQQRCAQPRA